MSSYKMMKMNGAPIKWAEGDVAVCRSCGALMNDYEPLAHGGEFYHAPRPGKPCKNDDKTFSFKAAGKHQYDRYFSQPNNKIELFERKSVRRSKKRTQKMSLKARRKLLLSR